MTTNTGLHVRDLSISYGANTVISRASFSVQTGEQVALLGPSGSGKSSILSAIAGLIPYAGSIAWNGEAIDTLPPHRREVGLVFQDHQLFPHLTVEKNIAFGLHMAKAPRGAQKERVGELLETVGLSGFERRDVATLSGGEAQRVALARALAPRPRVLLLDEPLSALDSELRVRLAEELRTILHGTQTTSILVTHDASEAQTICTRILKVSDHTVQ